VLDIDQHLVGGECPYYGCIPSKMMIRAENALAEGRRLPGLAGWSQIRADFVPVAARVPTRQLQQMTYAYPTFHRGIEDAPAAVGTVSRGRYR